MKPSVRLGRLFGIPIAADWSALLVLALITLIIADGVLPAAAPGYAASVYWATGVAAALVFLACLVAHELAHSVLAKRHGVPVKSITLWMLGGFSELTEEPPDPKADLVIAAAGPAASLAAGLLLGGGYLIGEALNASPLLTQALLWLATMNGVLAVFNLLPGAPLDGGRVLRALLWRRYHDRNRAEMASVRTGRTLGMAFMGVGFIEILFISLSNGIWTLLIGWFLTSAARAEGTAHLVRGALSSATAAEVMHPSPACAQAWQSLQTCAEQTVADSDQDVFPVVELAGEPVGVITADQIIAVPAHRRDELQVRSVMTPLPGGNVLAPDAPATELTGLRPIGRLVAVVVEGGHVTGMITIDDLQHILRRAMLLRRDSSDPQP
ncbi:site-2 protease family protein [Nonomuraea zeae]|uniref:Zinc metalloprotease n=1 Tax=Nonomuraea zeae TaxID=1642303 RepID=A0A5S4GY51_9ACTN|nr:site-2 protease family protein [Nonomuraea zeae]TMR37471.1 peptidase [Nonomuraea zeae]